MSSDREALRLRDICDNVEAIESYLLGLSASEFAADRKTVDAVERCLQRITEAVVKIGEDRMAVIAPNVPTHAVRALGNMLRHEYANIDLATIYNTAGTDLPPLKVACERQLQERQ